MHILLIEDDALVASGIVAGLRLHGLTVDHVENAQLADGAMAASQFASARNGVGRSWAQTGVAAAAWSRWKSPGMADVAPGYSTRMFGGKMWRTYVLQQGGIRVATADRIDLREALLRDVVLGAGTPFAVALIDSLLLLWSAIGRRRADQPAREGPSS